MNDDWLKFDEPERKAKPMPPDPSANRTISLSAHLQETPSVAAKWSSPVSFKPFPNGTHAVIARRSEWRAGSNNRDWLFLVWQQASDRRGPSLVDPIFLNSPSLQGRQAAIQKLSCIAGAAGLNLDTDAFKPSDLLGAMVCIEVVTRPHWNREGETVQAVAKYLPAPEV